MRGRVCLITSATAGLGLAPPKLSTVLGIVASMMTSLTRDEAIKRLQAVEAEIRRLGVRRLALFGSVLRNEGRPDSDVDVLVEFVPVEKSYTGAPGRDRNYRSPLSFHWPVHSG